jgi:putative ferrous iron transport protein C
MILSDLRDYLIVRRRAPLSDMATRFDVDADALRAMLDHWVRKGRVRLLAGGEGKCGGCCGCGDAVPEVYEWVELH